MIEINILKEKEEEKRPEDSGKWRIVAVSMIVLTVSLIIALICVIFRKNI